MACEGLAGGGVSGNLGGSVNDTYLLGAIGNRKTADALFEQAVSDGRSAIGSFPPNVGLLVRAARQGLRGIEADKQARTQADWAVRAMATEQQTSNAGYNPQRSFTVQQMQELASKPSPYLSAIKAKFSHFGVQIDEDSGKINIGNVAEVPLSLSAQQLNSALASRSDSDLKNILNSLAEKAFGKANLVGIPDVLSHRIRDQVRNGILSSEQAIQNAVNRGMAEAQLEVQRIKELEKLGEGSPQNLLAGQSPGELPSGESPAFDEGSVTASLGNEIGSEMQLAATVGENNLERFPASPQESSGEEPPVRLAEEEPPKERIGTIEKDIFQMLSKRYSILQAEHRLISESH